VNWVSDARRRLTLPAIMLATGAGYYLGSVVGFQLRVPPATTSIMWPPNAVLASALLLTSPTRWPLVLLSALPVHLLLEIQVGFPFPLIIGLFITNCFEALVAAGGLHLLSDAPSRFDTVRRFAAFLLAAVIAAPLLSTFADAAVVMWFRGEPYWQVWQTRLFSNTLAELTVVPAVVGTVPIALRGWRGISRGRVIEATILGLGLATIGWLDFSSLLGRIPSLRAVSHQTPLAVQLPFLLWAAMRFGPTGTGVSLLLTSVLSAWALVHGVGPFASIAPTITTTAVTLSLIVVATTLLSLATLLEERRQTQQALRLRLQFEGLLSRLSSTLVQQPSNQMSKAFDAWLGRIAVVLGVDAFTLFVSSPVAATPEVLYNWTESLEDVRTDAAIADQLRWAQRSFQLKETVLVGDDHRAHHDLDSPASVLTTGAAVPLLGEGQLLGALTFGSAGDLALTNDLLANARLVGEVLAGALRRRRSEDALRESEVMKSAILQSLSSGVAVIDRNGNVLQVNDRWKTFARTTDWMNGFPGGNLLDKCRAAFDQGDQLAGDLASGMSTVLDGTRKWFTIEHRTDAGLDAEWSSITAVPLNRPEGGAVLTRADITELRRAELEAQRSRQELAHVSRVSTVGEMTASLAHQLNQPLTAIMANAQAGGRMLAGPNPDVDEIREILDDIVKDDRRASDVIQRLRGLLRKSELEMAPLNLPTAIREVVELIASEAIIREIAISLDLADDPMFVRGDRVQLQQVILNLLHNAMDAITGQYQRSRTIAIECRPAPEPSVLVVRVRDSGPGLRVGSEEVIFEPFYTTKANGMGMGLSIVRSILEAHDGSIRALKEPAWGAVFELRLPRHLSSAS
jgi:signal transduction histidine kinase/integral membrane sensor domain MASE1